MYQSIFDYGKEFRVSHSILKKYSSRKVLEIGCGAGSLAGYFADAGYDYTGMDLAKPMLRIARASIQERISYTEICAGLQRRRGSTRYWLVDEASRT